MATTDTDWVKAVQLHRRWDWDEAHRGDSFVVVPGRPAPPDQPGHSKRSLMAPPAQGQAPHLGVLGVSLVCACHGEPCELLDSHGTFALVKAPGDEGTFAVALHDQNVRSSPLVSLRTMDVPPAKDKATALESQYRLTIAEAASTGVVVVGLRIAPATSPVGG